jgi:hypothetical protein
VTDLLTRLRGPRTHIRIDPSGKYWCGSPELGTSISDYHWHRRKVDQSIMGQISRLPEPMCTQCVLNTMKSDGESVILTEV